MECFNQINFCELRVQLYLKEITFNRLNVIISGKKYEDDFNSLNEQFYKNYSH